MAEKKKVDVKGARAATKLYGLGVVTDAMRGKTIAMAEDQISDPSSSFEGVAAAMDVRNLNVDRQIDSLEGKRSLKEDFNKLKGRAKDYIQQIRDPIVDAFLSVPDGDIEAGKAVMKAFKAYLPFRDSPDEEGDNVGIGGVTITNESQINYTPRSQSGGMGSSMADINKGMLPRGPNNYGMKPTERNNYGMKPR